MLAILFFIFGAALGSFLNVVVERIHDGRQFVAGRSACLTCKHFLGFFDLIPVISFLSLKGKCRYCQAKLSWQYFFMEIGVGALVLVGYFKYFQTTEQLLFTANWEQFLTYLLFLAFLVLIFLYDFKYFIIPDRFSLPAFVLAFMVNLLMGSDWLNLLMARLLAFGFFFLQFILSNGKWIGGGDLRLGLVMGAMLGWPNVLVALFIAYLVGAVVGVILLALKKKTGKSEIPFGPFLAIGTFASLLWGSQLLSWYLTTVL
jgi:prepilin signal peptidase PulO-like enzyme (type II secretory pathway)